MKKWQHDDLARDLARHLQNPRRLSWTDMQLGSSGSPRPDVYTLEKSYQRPDPTSYEVKVSRANFLSDTTSGKWQKYLKYSQCVIFAVPAGMIERKEIPAKCGLIVRHENGWRTMRRATRERCEMPRDALMKLIIDGASRVFAERIEPRPANAWAAVEAIRKKFGDRVAGVVHDVARAEERMSYASKAAAEVVAIAHESATKIRAKAHDDFHGLCEEVAEAFAIEDWRELEGVNLREEVRRRAKLLDANEELRRLRKIVEQLANQFETAVSPMMDSFPAAKVDVTGWNPVPSLSEWAERRNARRVKIQKRGI